VDILEAQKLFLNVLLREILKETHIVFLSVFWVQVYLIETLIVFLNLYIFQKYFIIFIGLHRTETLIVFPNEILIKEILKVLPKETPKDIPIDPLCNEISA